MLFPSFQLGVFIHHASAFMIVGCPVQIVCVWSSFSPRCSDRDGGGGGSGGKGGGPPPQKRCKWTQRRHSMIEGKSRLQPRWRGGGGKKGSPPPPRLRFSCGEGLFLNFDAGGVRYSVESESQESIPVFTKWRPPPNSDGKLLGKHVESNSKRNFLAPKEV